MNASTATITTITQRIVRNGSGTGTTPRMALMPQSSTPIMISAIRIPINMLIFLFLWLEPDLPVYLLRVPAREVMLPEQRRWLELGKFS
jgi:hypothetical protein